MKNLKEIAKRFKELRGIRAQLDLAKDLDIPIGVLRRLELGITPPKVEYLIKYSEYFKTSINWILFGKEIRSRDIRSDIESKQIIRLTELIIKKFPQFEGESLQEKVLQTLDSIYGQIEVPDSKAVDILIDVLFKPEKFESILKSIP